MSLYDDTIGNEERDFIFKPSTKEIFDEDGNVTEVGNLHFIQGILGQGAFGTVRLARRKIPYARDDHAGKSLQHTMSTPAGDGDGNFDPFGAQIFKTPPRRGRRPRRFEMSKSKSAPDDSDFFKAQVTPIRSSSNTSEVNKDINAMPTVQTPAAWNHREIDRHKSPSVVSKLGLFIQSRVSFDTNEDEDDEELVAVKIFSKSILKRRRTMERDKRSRRVRVRTALQQVEREIALMKKLSHPNLVNLYEVIDSPESDMLYMVLEYMPLGEILTYRNDGTFRRKDPRPGCTKHQVQGIVNGHFNEEQAALYFVDILHGLAYLHQHHIW